MAMFGAFHFQEFSHEFYVIGSVVAYIKTMYTLKPLALLITIVFSFQGMANENILPKSIALSKGYTPVSASYSLHKVSNKLKLPYKKHALDWPVKFEDGINSIGNLLAQYQSYEYSYRDYFHGGCDLVTKAQEKIIAPTSGYVEAGFYSYSPLGNGHFQKHWIPLQDSAGKETDNNYFEVAIIDKHGYRFEFHHVDPTSLTPKLIKSIYNRSYVEAGTELGEVKSWFWLHHNKSYHHVHYNVIAPSGVELNCEWLSRPLKDDVAPVINKVYAMITGIAFEVKDKEAIFRQPKELVIDLYDQKNNNPFMHQPHFIELKVESGRTFTWDFQKALVLKNGMKPNITDYFSLELANTHGEVVKTMGNYSEFKSLVKIPIDPNDFGQFVITVKDAMGNEAKFTGSLPGQGI